MLGGRWKQIRSGLLVLANSLLLMGLLFFNFVVMTIILISVDDFTDIHIVNTVIQRPDGQKWLILISLLSLYLVRVIERNRGGRKILGKIPQFMWQYVTVHSGEQLSNVEAYIHHKKKEAYVDYTVRSIPPVVFGLGAPFVLVYIYTKPFNFLAVSVLLIAIGISFGSMGSVMSMNVMESNSEMEYQQEMSELVAKQTESGFLITSAIVQFFAIFDIGLGEIDSIVQTSVLVFLFVGPAFGVFFLYLGRMDY